MSKGNEKDSKKTPKISKTSETGKCSKDSAGSKLTQSKTGKGISRTASKSLAGSALTQKPNKPKSTTGGPHGDDGGIND